jgi:hypothetical protein
VAHDGLAVRVEVDSALGSLDDLAHADALHGVFEFEERMQALLDGALTEKVVAVEVGGQVAAVVFECGWATACTRCSAGTTPTAVPLRRWRTSSSWHTWRAPPMRTRRSRAPAHLRREYVDQVPVFRRPGPELLGRRGRVAGDHAAGE